MTFNPTVQRYLDWLTDFVWKNSFGGPVYHRFFSFLFSAPFIPTCEMDGARVLDAEDLRYKFGDDCHVSYKTIQEDLDSNPNNCSMLEMMIALARRMEEHIMSDNSFGDRTGQWFWSMISSLGFHDIDDLHFDSNSAMHIVENFNSKWYAPNGAGGLFTVQNPSVDMRQYDIWYQMQIWINENYEGGI